MFVVCFLVAMICSYVIESTFHNFYLTVGLSGAIAVTSGFLVAKSEREEEE